MTFRVDPAVIHDAAEARSLVYPYATWMPIKEASTQAKIIPRLLIFHSQAGPAMTSLDALWKYVNRDDVHIEPTFILDFSGRMAQLVGILTRADCSASANPFSTAVETQDMGSAALAHTPWSPEQCEQLAGLAAFEHLHPGIRLSLVPATTWNGQGIGPHRQFPQWSVYVGKAVALDTLIPSPSGMTTMGALNVGDEVFDHMGQPCRVTATYDRMPEKAYRVSFDDGTEVLADSEHNWVTLDAKTLANRMGRRLPSLSSPTRKRKEVIHDYPEDWPSWTPVRTTADIIATPGRHHIPTTRPLQLATADLPLDPYLLGVWLGDGTSVRGDVTASELQGDADHMRAAFSDQGFEFGASVHNGTTTTFKVLGLRPFLREMDLIANKHVPDSYLWADAAQRLALLQGLMDTDGGVSPVGMCSFDNTNERLADAVLWLASSLGIAASKNKRRATLNGVDHGPSYRIHFTTGLPVFRLQRKLDRLRPTTNRRTKHRSIVSISPIEPIPMKCITVDSPQSMYLITEACIPTHNTCPGDARVAQIPGIIARAIEIADWEPEKPRPETPEIPGVRPPQETEDMANIGIIRIGTGNPEIDDPSHPDVFKPSANAQFIGFYVGEGRFFDVKWISTQAQIEARDHHRAGGARSFAFGKHVMKDTWVDKVPQGDGLTTWSDPDFAGVG